MMKSMYRILTLSALMTTLSLGLNAQTFSDDFESYTVGSYLAKSSAVWTTWSGTEGNTTDPLVVNSDAKSGTKSVLIASTATSGGPTDLVLPFGAEYSTGNFESSIWFKLPKGKGGYFNFQGKTKIGSIWTYSVFFTTDGTLNVTDPQNMIIFTSPYPQGKWFKLGLKGLLNSATWEVLLNDTSKGKFQTPCYSIAAMDFYPTDDKSQFWMDDVSYKYTPFTAPTLDAALGIVKTNGIKMKGLDDTLVVDVRNLGTSAINSVEITAVYNSNKITQTFNVPISAGAMATLKFTQLVNLLGGQNLLNAYISKVNGVAGDDFSADDSATISISGITPTPDKMVVGEEKTGTWCGWCVRGAVYMGMMNQNYGKYFGGITVHNADPMTVHDYDSFASTSWSGGFPNLILQRDTLFDPSAIESSFLKEITKPITVKVKNGAKWDVPSRTLTVSVTAEFLSGVTGDWRMACAITEDSVTGTATGYNQNNYYSGGGKGKMGGFENLTNPVLAKDMHYDDVARAVLPSPWGVKGMLPTTINSGDKQSINVQYIIPAGWDVTKLHIVSFVLTPTGKIDNGSKTTILEAVNNGFIEGIQNENSPIRSQIHVYPNPANDIINLSMTQAGNKPIQINVISIDGKVVSQMTYTPSNNISASIPMNVSALPQGVYWIETTMNGQKITKKFIKD